MLAGSGSPLWQHVERVLRDNNWLRDSLNLPCDNTHQAIDQLRIDGECERVGTVSSKETSGVSLRCSNDRNLELGIILKDMLQPRYLKKKVFVIFLFNLF